MDCDNLITNKKVHMDPKSVSISLRYVMLAGCFSCALFLIKFQAFSIRFK